MKNKTVLGITGFLLFVFGLLSVFLTLVGLSLDFFSFISQLGPGISFMIYLIFAITGISMIYVSRTSDTE